MGIVRWKDEQFCEKPALVLGIGKVQTCSTLVYLFVNYDASL